MTRVLGVDLGTVRVGLAVSDPQGILASPFEVIERTDAPAEIARRVSELGCEEIVVGIPFSLDGTKGSAADAAEEFAKQLESETLLPVVRWDERLTTVQAERSMRAGGKNAKQQRGSIDKVAAALILQAFLDSRRSS
jgi:putative Holliday junction resolvase